MSSDLAMDKLKGYYDQIYVVVSEKDEWIYDAINKGILNATGDYIILLNSNDVFYSSSSISDIVNFQQNNNCTGSLADVIFKDNSNIIIRYYSAGIWRPFLLRFGYMPPYQAIVITNNQNYFAMGLYCNKQCKTHTTSHLS